MKYLNFTYHWFSKIKSLLSISGRPSCVESLWNYAFIGICVLLLCMLAPLWRRTDCGGNNAASNDVRIYLAIAKEATEIDPSGGFRLSTITMRQREDLLKVSDDFWISPARFIVDTSFSHYESSENAKIVIVCDTAYNSPRRALFPGPPMYSAGYSDGSVRLISMDEHRSHDFSSFRRLDDILIYLDDSKVD
jgi:hypothetical protein